MFLLCAAARGCLSVCVSTINVSLKCEGLFVCVTHTTYILRARSSARETYNLKIFQLPAVYYRQKQALVSYFLYSNNKLFNFSTYLFQTHHARNNLKTLCTTFNSLTCFSVYLFKRQRFRFSRFYMIRNVGGSLFSLKDEKIIFTLYSFSLFA